MNVLPVKVNLLQRHIVEESVCSIHFLEKESISHVFFDCPHARRVRHLFERQLVANMYQPFLAVLENWFLNKSVDSMQ